MGKIELKSIEGYKAFNSDMTNNYGYKFEEGVTYRVDGDVAIGVNGNGFHMCRRLEDTCRYIAGHNMIITKVTGSGDICEGYDDYNEYYDMYSTSEITINHIMSREEVISEMLGKSELAVCRFIVTGYELTSQEVELFRANFASSLMVNQFLDYYALGDTEAFSRNLSHRYGK